MISGLAGVVHAQTVPTVSVYSGESSVVPGDTVTFNVTYRNNDQGILENGQLFLDLPLQSGLTLKSSNPPVDLSNGSPVWRLPTEIPSGGEGVLTLTVLVGSNYTGETVSMSGELDGQIDSQAVSSVSNMVSIAVTNTDEEDQTKKDKPEDEEKNKDENPDETDDNTDVKDDIKDEPVVKSEIQAKPLEQSDVENLIGVLNLPQTNVNAWDSRYLIIGGAAFVMIISASIIAFFLGRKSK